MKQSNQTGFDITHTTLSVLFIGVLTFLSIWILRPFLMPMGWATLIVVATWPSFIKLNAKLGGKRGLAVTIMTLAAMLALLVPLTLAVLMLVAHAENIPTLIQSFDFSVLSTPPQWLGRIPFAGEKLAMRWTTFSDLSQEARWEIIAPHARTALQWFLGKVGSIGLIITNAFIAIIFSAVLYVKGETVKAALLRFAYRLAGRHGEEAMLLAAKAARGVVLGVLGTALIQGLIGGLAILISGVPAASLLVAVMFLFCLAQLGPLLVLVPIVIWLYWTGHPVSGTLVLILTAIAGTIDNVVRPLLIRKGVELSVLVIMGGVIGGLIAFGLIGLFIGPVFLAVTQTLLNAWLADSDGKNVS